MQIFSLVAEVASETDLSMLERFEDYVVALVESGNVLAFVLVFVAGVLTSFTPCVYPVIPLTVGYIGAASGKSKLQGFTLSLAYVLGMAVVYTSIALILKFVFAKFFVVGAFSSSVWANLIIANLCLVFALGMLGVFEIKIPDFITRRLPQGGSVRGYIGAFLVGAVSGLIVGPCTGPVLGAILTVTSTSGSVIYAGTLMFVFSLGLGFLILIVGIFAGLIAALPKGGVWMVAVKVFFGILLLVTAEYFLFKAGAASI